MKKKVILNSKKDVSNVDESVPQYYYYNKSNSNEDGNMSRLFPNSKNIMPQLKPINIHNNVDDISIIKTYSEFLYENGEVFVDGSWYKNPFTAINATGCGVHGIKKLILEGKVCRRLGLGRIY